MCLKMQQNCLKLTDASHFLWGLNYYYFFHKLHLCLAAWSLLCFVYFDYHFYGFFCFHVPWATGISLWMKPLDEIMKNERKQTRRQGGGRDRRWKDIAEEWLSPSLYAGWVSICLTHCFLFNRGLTGTLKLDGQGIGAMSWFQSPNYSGWACLILTAGK